MLFFLPPIYFSAFIFYFLSQLKRKDSLRKTGFFIMLAAGAIHFFYLALKGIKLGYLPTFGSKDIMIESSFFIVFFFMFLFFKYKVDLLGGVVSILISVITLASLFMPEYQYQPPGNLNIVITAVHVFFTFLANAAFFMACILGCFYLIQERNIKEKKLGFVFKRMSSLEILEEAGNFCILCGFICLSAGIAIGIVWSKHIFGYFISFDIKELWSLLTWIIYAAIIHGRLTSEWKGKKAALMAILGFFIIIFSLIGINIFTDSFHGEFFKGSPANIVIKG